jgi:glutathione S-transferase
MTWTDIIFTTSMSVLALFAEKYNLDFSLDKFPKLVALVERVESNEGIAAWIAKRPETAM